MSQVKVIRAHLEAGRSITDAVARKIYRCTRLASIIHRLRERGYLIDTRLMPTGTGSKYALYVKAKPVVPDQARMEL